LSYLRNKNKSIVVGKTFKRLFISLKYEYF